MNQLTRQDIATIPKVELHTHLEGAIRITTIAELCQDLNIHIPTSSHQTNELDNDDPLAKYKKHFCMLENVVSLTAFLEKIVAIQQLFVSDAIIERIAFEVCEDAHRLGVKLIEIRYSPLFIIGKSEATRNSNLTFQSVYNAVCAGVARAQSKYDIAVGLIGILERDIDAEAQVDLFQHFCDSPKILAVDLANDETFSCVPFARFYQKDNCRLAKTCHAGESTTAHSVREAIEHLQVTRVGHGIKSVLDPAVLELVKAKNVHLEVCPISNVRTQSVESMAKHPIKEIRDAGISFSISSDDCGLFGITLIDEYEQLHLHHQFTKEDFLRCNINALEASFLPDDIKGAVKRKYFHTIL